MINATEQKPIVICLTCGVATQKVSMMESILLRNEKRKTYGRLIKPSFFKTAYINGKVIRVPQIFKPNSSYFWLTPEEGGGGCIPFKHKLSVRVKPFSEKILFSKNKEGKLKNRIV